MKLSQWLKEFNSHGIYVTVEIEKELNEKFSKDIRLPYTTVGKLRGWIGTFKGPEALTGEYNEHITDGWELAHILASRELGYQPDAGLNGRGSRFDACVNALEKSGR